MTPFKVAIVVTVIWLILIYSARASKAAEKAADVTVKGDVDIGDGWSATFTAGNGNWSDVYRTHADEEQQLQQARELFQGSEGT